MLPCRFSCCSKQRQGRSFRRRWRRQWRWWWQFRTRQRALSLAQCSRQCKHRLILHLHKPLTFPEKKECSSGSQNSERNYFYSIAIEYEIIGEGSQISTNQKRESTVSWLLIGRNLRPFPDNFVLYREGYHSPCPFCLLIGTRTQDSHSEKMNTIPDRNCTKWSWKRTQKNFSLEDLNLLQEVFIWSVSVFATCHVSANT